MSKLSYAPNKLEAKRTATINALFEAGVETLQSPYARTNDLKGLQLSQLANRTTGAFFGIWPRQDFYTEALAKHVMSPQHDSDFDFKDVLHGQTLPVHPKVWAGMSISSLASNAMFLPGRAFRDSELATSLYPQTVASYINRQATAIQTSLAESIDVQHDHEFSEVIAMTAEDLVIRSMRGNITERAAADALSRLVS